jgi:hypothetical protein
MRFCPTLHEHAHVVDSIDDILSEVVDSVLDFFVSELRITALMRAQGPSGINIVLPAGCQLIGCLRRHDAIVIRTRLEKEWQVGSAGLQKLAHIICECYALPHSRSLSISKGECEDMALKCVEFLANLERQCDHLASDDQRLLILERTVEDPLETGDSLI